ncbi:MAG: hypothetical protein MUP81_01515 [Dehalococcoidia bacterium]|nr:hypothetical protein [Dehalococcoidia bacterium]
MRKLLLIPFILLLIPAIPFFVLLRYIGYPKGFAYEPIKEMIVGLIEEVGKP